MVEPVEQYERFTWRFRNDLERIDAGRVGLCRGKEGLPPPLNVSGSFNEILIWHAHGEELAIFPLVDNVAPRLQKPM